MNSQPEFAVPSAAGRSQDLVAAVIRASPVATALTRLSDGCFLECNDAMHDVTEYRREELIGRTAMELGLWHEPAEREAFIRTLREAGRVDRQVMAFRTKSGDVHVGAFSAWLVVHEREPCILAVISEATDRFRAERRARLAESRYRNTVENIPAVTYIEALEEDPITLYMSPQIEALLGFSPEEFRTPSDWESRVHPEDRERVLGSNARANRTGQPFREEYRLLARDGREVWVRDQAVLVDDPDGASPYWFGVFLDITEQKETELRLRELDTRYRALIEHTPAVIYMQLESVPFSSIYVSPRIEEVLGYAPDEFADEAFWNQLLHPDDRERALAVDAEAFATHGPYANEYRLRARDGRWVWFRDEAVFVEDGSGGTWYGVLLDITDSKEAGHRLSELEARYRNLVEQLPAITYLDALDENMTSLYVSPQVQEVLGIPADAFQTEDLWEAQIHPDDRELAVRKTREGVARGEPFTLEYRMLGADGRTVWVRDQASTVRNADGIPRYVQGVLIDVTQQKQSEEELREAAAKFRTLVEQIPAITYTYEETEAGSGEYVTTYVSPQIEGILGYPASQWIDERDLWARLLHPDDRERVLAEETRTDTTGEPFLMEYRKIARDGRVVWVREEARLIRDQPGLPRQWLGLMFDITDRKQAEQKLATSYELLSATDKERRRLLRRVVDVQEEERRRIAVDIHDDSIQKMTAVGLRLETLSMKLGDGVEPELLASLKQTVGDSIGRLRHLMSELRPAALDRDGLVAAISEILPRLADETGLRTELENRLVTEPTPAVAANAFRIVQEALANVRKHAGASAVEICLEPREEGVYVRIRDDGRGFDPEAFRPEPGHLGVPAMRERAELAGGWFRIAGAAGAGTTVEFWLPTGEPTTMRPDV